MKPNLDSLALLQLAEATMEVHPEADTAAAVAADIVEEVTEPLLQVVDDRFSSTTFVHPSNFTPFPQHDTGY